MQTTEQTSNEVMDQQIRRGKVAHFDRAKGYGFITPSVGGPDVFVHFSAIDSPEKFRYLEEAQLVEYVLCAGRPGKGPMAGHVRVCQ